MSNPNTARIEALKEAYKGFNSRDVDAVLPLMSPDVKWPRAFKGGYVEGPAEIRAYWTEQWSEIDPTVEPIGFSETEDDKVLVTVRQVVKDRSGNLLGEGEVGHLFTFSGDLIAQMDLAEG